VALRWQVSATKIVCFPSKATCGQDFQLVANRLEVPSKLKRLNRTRPTIYQQCYDDHTSDLIATTFQADIVEFGYQFDGDSKQAKAQKLLVA